MMKNNRLSRASVLQKITQEKSWDMVIAGGGITGAGVAREAARRGLNVLLVERKDFAWGTSSRSSKMVHGGLRYLGQGDYKTTMHSVRERERLLNEAKGLVDEMPYVMAHYKGVFPPPWAFNILLCGYDFFAGKKYRKYHKKQNFIKINPEIKQEGLLGVTQFADAVTDDARLVMRVLYEAKKDGAYVLNYVSVSDLLTDEQGKVTGVIIKDEKTGDVFNINAKVVVSATGAWADELRKKAISKNMSAKNMAAKNMAAKNTADSTTKNAANKITMKKIANKVRPTRGSHIVVAREKLPVEHAYTLMHPQDKRALFVFPWETRTVIGTTDLDHPNLDNNEVGITQAELDYLLAAGQNLFPHAKLSKDDVICTWAGVRPLISSTEDGKRVHPSKEKREHSVWQNNGLITVSGGKLTTFRLIALDVLKASEALLHITITDDNATMFSPASTDITQYDRVFHELDTDTQTRLLGHYGEAVAALLKVAKENELTRIPQTNTLWAELRFAAAYEQIQHLDDLLLRRTRLGLLLENGGMSHAEKIRQICADELGWREEKWQTEATRYQNIWQQYYYLPSDMETKANANTEEFATPTPVPRN